MKKTTDKNVIRKAYSQLVKQYHPEEQPEKYKEIREAYEQALFYVRYSSQVEENDQEILLSQEDVSFETILSDEENDDQDDSYIDKEMKELIRNGMSTIIQNTNSIYETKPNDLEAWKQCFENGKEHEELILETIFRTSMELITDERIILYLKDVVKSLPRKDVDIYNKRLLHLEEQLSHIKKSIFGHVLLEIFEVLSGLLMIITIPLCVIGIVWIGYKAIFQTHQPTVDYLFFVFLSIWVLYRLYHICMRNIDTNKRFFYRDYKLVGITLLASVLSLTYVYTFFSLIGVVQEIYGLNYILIIELLGMQYLFRKESYKEIYQHQSIGVEALMLPNGIFIFFFCVLFVIYFIMFLVTRNTNYISPLLLIVFAYFIIYIHMSLSTDDYYKKIYPTLQNFICWLILLSYLGMAHLGVQFFRTSNINHLNEESRLVLGFVFIFWFFIIILYFVLKLKRKKNLKQIFTKDSYTAVIEMFTYLSSQCKNGEEIEKFNEFQRCFYVVQFMNMEMRNGGFYQFYFSNAGNNIEKIIEGLKIMGGSYYIDLITQSQSIFPLDYDFSNCEARQIELERLMKREENVELFKRLDNMYNKQEQQIYQICYEYMIKNKNLFPLK